MKNSLCIITVILFTGTLFIYGNLYSQSGSEIPYTNFTEIEIDRANAAGKIAEIDLRFDSNWQPDKLHHSVMKFWTVDAKCIYLKAHNKFTKVIKEMKETNSFRTIRFMITGTGPEITGEIKSIE